MDVSFPPLCPTAPSRLWGCQVSWVKTSHTSKQASFQHKKPRKWSEIPHGNVQKQFGANTFSLPGRRMLHTITPAAKRGRNEERKIDSSFNKLWAQLAIVFLVQLHFRNCVSCQLWAVAHFHECKNSMS